MFRNCVLKKNDIEMVIEESEDKAMGFIEKGLTKTEN